ncbi:MAG: hypothetical protein IPK88_19010 [Saprospiraceae bacterium]|nr:hypothetical protein [Candidatus Defluviibacterium haderslevense]
MFNLFHTFNGDGTNVTIPGPHFCQQILHVQIMVIEYVIHHRINKEIMALRIRAPQMEYGIIQDIIS